MTNGVVTNGVTSGLEDVVAAETVLSDVDGAAGRLMIRGRALDALAGVWRFEDVARLLLDGFFPDLPPDGDALAAALGAARADAYARCSALLPALAALDVSTAFARAWRCSPTATGWTTRCG